jgi:hypothetical protein
VVLDRNVLEIALNSLEEVSLEGNVSNISELKGICRKHILNNGLDPNFSENPKKAIVSIENSRGLSYDLYIQILNELKIAYGNIRNEEAILITKGEYNYAQLKTCSESNLQESEKCKKFKTLVKEKYPMNIVEKEVK